MANQKGNDQLADDDNADGGAVADAQKKAADTTADDANTGTGAVAQAGLTDVNQVVDDAKAATEAVNTAAEKSLNDAFAAAVAFALSLLPKSDQPIYDGSFLVGSTEVDAQGNVWVKRYLPLPGNQSGSTWFYRSLGEVQANVEK